MSVNCRELFLFEVNGEEVLLDAYAVWKDLGNGYLQPVQSTQTTPGVSYIAVGRGLTTGGVTYKKLSDTPVYRNTSMNNLRR